MTPENAVPLRTLGITDIHQHIPHRYPFLLIDKVEIHEEGKRAVGVKCVSANEHFFQGHFPGRPVMPGVLILEALAQAGCALLMSDPNSPVRDKIAFFMSIDNAKFRNPVLPGSVLRLNVELKSLRSRAGTVRAEAFVDGKPAAEADMAFALLPK